MNGYKMNLGIITFVSGQRVQPPLIQGGSPRGSDRYERPHLVCVEVQLVRRPEIDVSALRPVLHLLSHILGCNFMRDVVGPG